LRSTKASSAANANHRAATSYHLEMRRCRILLALALGAPSLLLACNSGTRPVTDAGAGCDGACGTTLADYCQSNPCPSTPAEAVAELCAAGDAVKVYTDCGHTVVIASGAGASGQFYFDADGGLLVIYDTQAAATCCVAGPQGFEPAGLQGCTLALASCAAGADAGAAADASDASGD
jgi:hypothetical protein